MPVIDFHIDQRSPFTERVDLAVDSRLPDLEVRVLDGKDPEDLTGAGVTFTLTSEAGVVKVTAAAAVLDADPTTGKVKYLWATSDLDTAGRFFGQFTITISSKKLLVPNDSTQRLLIVVGPVA